MVVNIKVKGQDSASAALRRMARRLDSPRSALDQSGLLVRKDLQAKLRTGKDFRGRRLKPITDSTRARRASGGFAEGPPLRRSGKMIQSLRHSATRKKAIVRPRTREMRKIAAIQQRRFQWAGVSNNNERQIRSKFNSFSRDVIRKNGGAP